MIPIASGYTNAISGVSGLYNGDLVGINNGSGATAGALSSTGYTVASTTGAAGAAVGVFSGCEYSSAGSVITGKNRYNYWANGTVAQDAVGYVVDDPLALFKSAVLVQPITTLSNTASTVGYMSPAFVGTNVNYVTGTTGTASGNSTGGVSGGVVTGTNPVSGTTRQTSAGIFRVVQLVQETSVVVTATATAAASSTTVTLNSVAGISPGMQIITSGSSTGGAPSQNNVVVTVNSVANTLTVASAVVIAAGSTSVSFVGYPEVIVAWNPAFHAYNVAAGL
jgi:hypothetical protein